MRPSILKRQKQLFSPAAIELALQRLELEYNRGNKEAIICCMFHDDSSRHMYVNLELKPGVFHCFRCHAKGSFEALVREATGWSVIKAATFMHDCIRDVAAEDYEPPVREQIDLSDDATRLAPYWFRHPYPSTRGLLEETLVRFSIGYDRKDNSITFPWFTRTGKLLSIKRRNIIDKYYSAEKHVNTTSTLFGMHLAKQHGYLWLTEGEFDCMFLDQCFRLGHFDDQFALALGGTAMHSNTIIELCKLQPERVVLFLDNDDAGIAAQRIIKKQLAGFVRLLEPKYPADVSDPNELTFEQAVRIVRSLDSLR